MADEPGIFHAHQTSLPDDPDSEISASIWNTDPHDIGPGTITREMLAADVRIVCWAGVWAVGTDYVVGDAVFHEGSSYVCLTAHSGSTPPSVYWDRLAERGATWWEGSGVPGFVPGSSPGDYYLDVETGIVYQLG